MEGASRISRSYTRNMIFFPRHWAAYCLSAGLLVPALIGNENRPAPATAEEVVARMTAAEDARIPQLHDYTSIRRYSLDNDRFGVHASMKVRVTYQAPGQKQFEILEQTGPGAIRSKVFRRMLDSELKGSNGAGREETRLSPRNYEFVLAGSEMREGRRCYVLEVAPKTTNPLLFRGRITVDAEDFAVTAMDGEPAQNPSFWLRKTAIAHRYARFGSFWLPVSNNSSSEVRVFGRTRVRIEYSDYRINTGATTTPATAAE